MISPRLASGGPAYHLSLPLPPMNAPPWIHTITGSLCAPDGAHTFKYKQSSSSLEPRKLCGHSLP
jgi:hypothetical protein